MSAAAARTGATRGGGGVGGATAGAGVADDAVGCVATSLGTSAVAGVVVSGCEHAKADATNNKAPNCGPARLPLPWGALRVRGPPDIDIDRSTRLRGKRLQGSARSDKQPRRGFVETHQVDAGQRVALCQGLCRS